MNKHDKLVNHFRILHPLLITS